MTLIAFLCSVLYYQNIILLFRSFLLFCSVCRNISNWKRKVRDICACVRHVLLLSNLDCDTIPSLPIPNFQHCGVHIHSTLICFWHLSRPDMLGSCSRRSCRIWLFFMGPAQSKSKLIRRGHCISSPLPVYLPYPLLVGFVSSVSTYFSSISIHSFLFLTFRIQVQIISCLNSKFL